MNSEGGGGDWERGRLGDWKRLRDEGVDFIRTISYI
jgi:hypothetical protein